MWTTSFVEIHSPKLNIPLTITMGELMETAILGVGALPQAVQWSWQELGPEHQLLRKLSYEAWIESQMSGDIRIVLMQIQGAWRAFRFFLQGRMAMPVKLHPTMSSEAKAIDDAIFDKGLSFLNLRAHDVFQESRKRSRRLVDEFQAKVEEMGGVAYTSGIASANEATDGLWARQLPSADDPVPDKVGVVQRRVFELTKGFLLQVSAHAHQNPDWAPVAARLVWPVHHCAELAKQAKAKSSNASNPSGANPGNGASNSNNGSSTGSGSINGGPSAGSSGGSPSVGASNGGASGGSSGGNPSAGPSNGGTSGGPSNGQPTNGPSNDQSSAGPANDNTASGPSNDGASSGDAASCGSGVAGSSNESPADATPSSNDDTVEALTRSEGWTIELRRRKL